jgi:hypothetical protein
MLTLTKNVTARPVTHHRARLDNDAFDELRRKWATERKHLPDMDVAKAGGWRSVMR